MSKPTHSAKTSRRTLANVLLVVSLAYLALSWRYYTCHIKGFCDPKSYQKSVDTDNDGIPDIIERQFGTSVHNIDSDNDGIQDGDEVGLLMRHPVDTDNDRIIDAMDTDDDNDGVLTRDELLLNTDPKAIDTDRDGINDAIELGINVAEPLDSDHDGIINALDTDDDNDGLQTRSELILRSNPLNTDSDGDGISDRIEVANLSAPKDSDQDGMLDIIDATDNASLALASVDNDTEVLSKLASNSEPLIDGYNNALKPQHIEQSKLAAASNYHSNAEEGTPPQIHKPSSDDSRSDFDDETPHRSPSMSLGQAIQNLYEQTINSANDAPSKQQVSTKDSAPALEAQNKQALAHYKQRFEIPYPYLTPQNIDRYKPVIERLVAWLNETDYNRVVITAYTDVAESRAASLQVGIENAMKVRETLINQGADFRKINFRSRGALDYKTEQILNEFTPSNRMIVISTEKLLQ